MQQHYQLRIFKNQHNDKAKTHLNQHQ